MAVPWTVCRRRQVRRCHVTCGTCLAPRPRRARAPAATPGECCRRVSCHGHAHHKRGSPRTTTSPRRVRVCMLASRDLSSAQQTSRVCASAALAPRIRRSQPRHSRLPSTRHVESDIWAASRHFMATLGAPPPRRSERNTRGILLSLARRAVATSTNSLLEDRIRAQHMMRGCAPTRMSEAATTSLATAHMLITNNKQLGERCKEFQQIAKA